MLGAIRPDDWNLPLFLHMLGAMVAGRRARARGRSRWHRRAGATPRPACGSAYRSLLLGAIPGWIVMRLAAQWIADKEGLDDLDEPPAWVDIGFITSEPTLLLLIAATVCAGIAARRAREGGRALRRPEHGRAGARVHHPARLRAGDLGDEHEAGLRAPSCASSSARTAASASDAAWDSDSCWCSQAEVDAEALAELTGGGGDCLCPACLPLAEPASGAPHTAA